MPYAVKDIDNIESVQPRFTKRLPWFWRLDLCLYYTLQLATDSDTDTDTHILALLPRHEFQQNPQDGLLRLPQNAACFPDLLTQSSPIFGKNAGRAYISDIFLNE